MVAVDTAGKDGASVKPGDLMEYRPSYVSPSSISQAPSPPVFHSELGKTPLSKFSVSVADMQVLVSGGDVGGGVVAVVGGGVSGVVGADVDKGVRPPS